MTGIMVAARAPHNRAGLGRVAAFSTAGVTAAMAGGLRVSAGTEEAGPDLPAHGERGHDLQPAA